MPTENKLHDYNFMTNKSKEQVKACPFCSSEVEYAGMEKTFCGAIGVYRHPRTDCVLSEAIFRQKGWNSRPRELALIEGLKKANEALERIANEAFNPNKLRHRRAGFEGSLCDITCQSCAVNNAKSALKSISALLSTEAQQ